ncbi:MAG: lipid-A-disaccharide synthase [Bdellovibrionales bacterium]|nr:lipid-A-disaccharide synthase [Bdellovibrionales bacterium]
MISTNDCPEILIVAAEASSSLYAQRLLEYWNANQIKYKSFGIGSQAMIHLGFEALGRSEDLAVVGLQEVLAHWGQIKQAFNLIIQEAQKRRPKVALLLDYPDFNLRLAKRLKQLDIKVIYYISPQVWAWRQSRVHLIKKVVDKMLVLFPFEADFYNKFQVPVEFVGHPLLDELKGDLFSRDAIGIRRERYGLKKEDLVLALMPGSRHSELKHHLQLQIDTAKLLIQKHPDLKVILLIAPTMQKEDVLNHLSPLDIPLTLIQDEPFSMISMADIVLCASGTATLMVGLMEKPMVIMYRMNGFTAWLAKKFVKSTAHFGLVNLVLGHRVVPELFQEQAGVEKLVFELQKIIDQKETREQIVKQLAQVKNKLGQSGATVKVANVVESMW